MSVKTETDVLAKVAVSLDIPRKEQSPQDFWLQIRGQLDRLYDGYDERNKKAVWLIICTVLEEIDVKWDDLPVLTREIIVRRLGQDLPIIRNGKLK